MLVARGAAGKVRLVLLALRVREVRALVDVQRQAETAFERAEVCPDVSFCHSTADSRLEEGGRTSSTVVVKSLATPPLHYACHPQRHLPQNVWVLGQVNRLHRELAQPLATVHRRLGRARNARTALVRTRAILVVWSQLSSREIVAAENVPMMDEGKDVGGLSGIRCG